MSDFQIESLAPTNIQPSGGKHAKKNESIIT